MNWLRRLFLGLNSMCLLLFVVMIVKQTNRTRSLNGKHGNNSNLPHFKVNVSTERTTSPDPVDDYYRFPCAGQLGPSDGGPCVRTLCGDRACGNILDNCTQSNLKTLNNISICSYDLTDFIAKRIRKYGVWENGLLQNMMGVLRANPDMVLLDIGCNIGVYTLAAAWLSRRVICLDANYENLRLVNKSLALNNMTENVTLIWNALSNVSGETTLKIIKGNRGASRVEDMEHTQWHFTVLRRIRTRIITLDQLLPLVKGKPVFMKIDIEGLELNALKGGKEFLRMVDMRYIQMEVWRADTKLEIAKLLSKYGFLPFSDIRGKHRIDEESLFKPRMTDLYYIQRKQFRK